MDGEFADYCDYLDACMDHREAEDSYWENCAEQDDPMDGDHESGLASAGWGTDEDYGYYPDGEDY